MGTWRAIFDNNCPMPSKPCSSIGSPAADCSERLVGEPLWKMAFSHLADQVEVQFATAPLHHWLFAILGRASGTANGLAVLLGKASDFTAHIMSGSQHV